MPAIEASSGVESIITPCIRLQFSWMGEHWKHELISDGGCQAIPRIWSVEGQIKREGPGEAASPAFERIKMTRDRPGVAVAHLSGRSEQRRIEGTFTVEEKPDGVVIDVAVTHSPAEAGETFCVTYLVEASDGELKVGEAATITFHHPETQLVFEALGSTRVEAEEAGMGTIRLRATSEPDTAGESHTFHYRWRWVQAPAHQVWDRTA